jgi:hypothetical protein
MAAMTIIVFDALQSPSANNCHFIRWLLPYGGWRCRDGREILFDRTYCPIVQRYPNCPPTMADRSEWVHHIIEERWFYHDGVKDKSSVKNVSSRWD